MTLLDLVNKKLAIETILAQVFILWAVVHLLFLRKKYHGITHFFGKYGIIFTFFTSLAAIVSSLFYSQVAGFEPCNLCWMQRIFIYPVVILAGLAFIKKDKKIADYILSLSIIGIAISLFHNYIYYFGGPLSGFCQIGGLGISCVRRYVFEFWYVTIPLMSLTAFTLIIIFMVFTKLYEKNHQ